MGHVNVQPTRSAKSQAALDHSKRKWIPCKKVGALASRFKTGEILLQVGHGHLAPSMMKPAANQFGIVPPSRLLTWS